MARVPPACQTSYAAQGGTGYWGKYAYAWLTLGFFLISLILHWVTAWFTFVQDSAQHNAAPEVTAYV